MTDPEEILFENARVSLCLLVNRHARTMRLYDFRAGFDPTKRGYVLSIAQREGVERLYAVVERDEVSTWLRLGLEREGTIPGFFKRSDAHVVGLRVPPALEGGAAEPVADRARSRETLSERLYQDARRVAKELAASPARGVRVAPAPEAVVKRALAAAARGRRGLTRFERFGRDVERRELTMTARGGWSLLASVEKQVCFDNAFIEVLVGPRTERESGLTHAGLVALCDRLRAEGTVSAFATCPVADTGLAAAYLACGFRRTGTLPDHLLVGDERADAFLLTRKLSSPGAEPFPE